MNKKSLRKRIWEILEKGNLYKGLKRGIITTNDGVNIKADNFTYNKITNVVEAEGKVKVEDVVNNYVIFSDKATYKKNEEIIFTEGNSKGIDDKNRIQLITWLTIENAMHMYIIFQYFFVLVLFL